MSLMAGKALSSARMSDAVLSQSSLMGSQPLHDGESEEGECLEPPALPGGASLHVQPKASDLRLGRVTRLLGLAQESETGTVLDLRGGEHL